ncbi:MAG: YraN family protein [Actinobacteria bacterium]|nr:YraN family protein [Actinomycetota bacterium]
MQFQDTAHVLFTGSLSKGWALRKSRRYGGRVLPGKDRRQRLGNAGEEVACGYLANNGLEILDRNWRTKSGELDIIVRDGAAIVFVEVKTRLNKAYGEPEESITRKKTERIRRLALAYMSESGLKGEMRFDVISVLPDDTGEDWSVRHLKNAF